MMLLSELIQNKSLAIIGNSPKEVGTGNGAKIDRYDLVARFKNYSTKEEYQRDYGKKASIWVTPFNKTQFWRPPFYYKAICCTLPLYKKKWRAFYTKHNINYDMVEKLNDYIEFIPAEIFEEAFYMYPKTCQPSSGMLFLFWLFNLKGKKLSREDIYGFSMFDPKEDHHYFLKDELDPNNRDLSDTQKRTQRLWFATTSITHPREYEIKLFNKITE